MARLLNRRLGNYVLRKLIARGGFADIYLAQHLYLKRYVVIKVMSKQPQQPGRRAFLREAQIMASLNHRNIVRILDFGVDGNTPFIVMSYFPRGSLRMKHPRGARLSLSVILCYLQDIAEALEYIHDRGYVHQDIKPENMLVGPRNEIVLCDFGIAIAFNEAIFQGLDEIVGTASYMAPERFEGSVCAASDQYALGIVVYEWLAGEPPFSGTYGEIAWKHLHASPPLLRAKRPEIPPGVEQVILRALEKDPMNRFESVKDFVAALGLAAATTRLTPTVPSRALSAGNRKQKALFFVCGLLISSISSFISYLLGIEIGVAVLVSVTCFFLLMALSWNTEQKE